MHTSTQPDPAPLGTFCPAAQLPCLPGTNPDVLQRSYNVSQRPQAWENFLDWVNDSLPLDTILEFVSLYWFTKSFPRAIYPYREVGPLLDRLAKILILMIL